MRCRMKEVMAPMGGQGENEGLAIIETHESSSSFTCAIFTMVMCETLTSDLFIISISLDVP